jgi:hypothetical protein
MVSAVAAAAAIVSATTALLGLNFVRVVSNVKAIPSAKNSNTAAL